jgi:hypothetical protein
MQRPPVGGLLVTGWTRAVQGMQHGTTTYRAIARPCSGAMRCSLALKRQRAAARLLDFVKPASGFAVRGWLALARQPAAARRLDFVKPASL